MMIALHIKDAALAVVCLLLVIQANAYTMENMCEQWSGEGYVGNPTDCTSWGYCKGQKVISRGSCGKGLVFDSDSSTCQYNTKVPCSTSVAQTCSALTTAGFMADPTNCNQYAYCFGNGKSQIQKCPPGQNYAANNNTCVWGPSCPQSSICQFMPNNIYVGDPTNCGSYLQCIKGYGVAGSCPVEGGPFYYNAATGNCEKTNPCTDNGNNTPDPDGLILPPSSTACNGVAPGTEFISDKRTCYGFYSCAEDSVGTWGACPYGTEYNPTTNKCVSPADYACFFNRCLNTNLTFAVLQNSNCEQYTYCPNGSVGTCPTGYPYYDEILQKCVPKQPDYVICKATATPPGP